ncbi:F-box/RNI-like superfamily protein [Rhynchospora pubera]|uniref:F-box/RNI-like superfamily protein n=1 Tax=Rhynchospora pubera TaxID=906938 RepID=A0AAV8FME8_9POAL|nr:F-box/RNI-like superfamily protein [Rhynchospora pubera]
MSSFSLHNPPQQPMSGADRISALPLEIKVSILCCLDVKHAIRMSALTRSWRHIYTLLPGLCLGCSLDQLGETPQNPVAPDWIERIHHVISSLRGPFLIFKLSHFFSTDQSELLQSLLNLLLQKGGAQTLSLSSYRNRVQVHLPSFHFLKVLQLSQCHVVLPVGFQGFNRLVTLTLRDVEISNLHLHLLIHTSNNLTKIQFLDLVAIENPLSVNISLPLLRHLQFGINDVVDKLYIVSAPCLEQARIFFRKPSHSRITMLACVTLELVTSVATVSTLHLDCGVLKSLSLVSLPFNFTFPRLRCLKFFLNIATMDKRMYGVFIWLLRSMSFLEELEIKLANSDSRRTNFLIRDLKRNKMVSPASVRL